MSILKHNKFVKKSKLLLYGIGW